MKTYEKPAEEGAEQEPECEQCERLKQLVFQAKEAIDDLKQEIDEWREISAQKETELRQLHHRLHRDLLSQNKEVVFDEVVVMKEYDGSRPVSVDKIKNFI